MNKLTKALCLSIVLCAAVFAQTTDDEYKKSEFYVGYSNQRVDIGDRRAFNGFEVSATRNFNRFFGIKADVSGAYRNNSSTYQISNGTATDTLTTEADRSPYNFLAGVQVKDNATGARFKPFAHALCRRRSQARRIRHLLRIDELHGSAHRRTFQKKRDGIRRRVRRRLGHQTQRPHRFRAIQVDYNPVTQTVRSTTTPASAPGLFLNNRDKNLVNKKGQKRENKISLFCPFYCLLNF
ncbi:MAG: hypothetical protein JWN60_2293 [Acidobacteria bacterium]|nr:hypothetical protein [Acidobacteriota bacterium]